MTHRTIEELKKIINAAPLGACISLTAEENDLWWKYCDTPEHLRASFLQTEKLSNPKDALGVKKLSFSVLPWRVLCNVALAMMEGAAKYGRHNYRAVGVRASVYFDATVARHLTQWWEGEDIDADSGLHHVDKAIASLFVLRDSMLQGNFVDDRPPTSNIDMTALNQQAAKILETHADKNPMHYTIANTQGELR